MLPNGHIKCDFYNQTSEFLEMVEMLFLFLAEARRLGKLGHLLSYLWCFYVVQGN